MNDNEKHLLKKRTKGGQRGSTVECVGGDFLGRNCWGTGIVKRARDTRIQGNKDVESRPPTLLRFSLVGHGRDRLSLTS